MSWFLAWWPALICCKAVHRNIAAKRMPGFVCWLVGYLCQVARQIHILLCCRQGLGGGGVNISGRSKGVGRGLEEENEELGLQVVKLASIFVFCCWSRGIQSWAVLQRCQLHICAALYPCAMSRQHLMENFTNQLVPEMWFEFLPLPGQKLYMDSCMRQTCNSFS